MIDPKRLLDDDTDAFAAGLLRAHKEDLAPDPLYRATLIAMGVGAATGAAGANEAAAHAPKAAGAASMQGVSASKWVIGGILGGVVAVSAIGALHGRSGPTLPTPASAQISTEEGALLSAPVASVPRDESLASSQAIEAPQTSKDSVSSETLPSARTDALVRPQSGAPIDSAPMMNPMPSAAPQYAASRTAPVPAASLLAEVGELDRVRSAITAGRPQDALRNLDDYRRTFPGGALGPEATVLRIEALVAAGQMSAAASLANQFLRSPASAPHATRVRSLMKRVSNP